MQTYPQGVLLVHDAGLRLVFAARLMDRRFEDLSICLRGRHTDVPFQSVPWTSGPLRGAWNRHFRL